MTDPKALANALIPRLELRGFAAEYAETREQAKRAVLGAIPPGETVMAGASVTMDDIGVTQALVDGDYDYLRAKIRAESDPARRQQMRVKGITAPYFLSGVNAITEDGRLVFAEYGGTRLASIVAGATKVILASSLTKVVPDLDAAFRRITDVALPLESERLAKALGKPGVQSHTHKWLVLDGEMHPGRVRIVLVGEPLGY